MSSLEQFGKYCDINATDPTTILYYVIKYLSEPYILQEYQTTDGQVIKAGEPLFKPEYLSLMKAKINWYWQQHGTNKNCQFLCSQNCETRNFFAQNMHETIH